MDKSNLWRLSATEIVKATTAGEIRSIDVVTSVIDRMRKINPKLNAVVIDLSEQALKTAEKVFTSMDALRASAILTKMKAANESQLYISHAIDRLGVIMGRSGCFFNIPNATGNPNGSATSPASPSESTEPAIILTPCSANATRRASNPARSRRQYGHQCPR